MTLTVVLAGGGTAGHVNPMLATAAVLRDRGFRIGVIGTEEGLESELVPASGYPMRTIPKTPIPRRPSLDWFTLPGRLSEANRRARDIIADADAVIGFGGYVSAPAYSAAKKLSTPLVIHEQNARPGVANRWGARFAAAVGLTFHNTQLRATHGITEVTGLPLRQPIAELAKNRSTVEGARAAREEAARRLGLEPDLPTLLITGGSLGAVSLNEAMAAAAPSLPAGVQVLHLTGKNKAAGLQVPWQTREYLEEMELALAVADLVICRSGAGTVAELAVLGLPACFVPLPIGNGEQRLNATDMVEAGGALVIEDKDFTADTIIDTVFPLIDDPTTLRRMGEAARTTGVSGAAEKVANLVEAVIREH